MLKSHQDVPVKLRALWTLHASGGMELPQLESLLQDPYEHLRSWAVRLLVDFPPPTSSTLERFADLALNDRSPLVRLFLASALQRIPISERWQIAEGLVRHEDGDDPNLPLMIWYGIEPILTSDRPRALQLAAASKMPLLRQHIARRMVNPD
jgi:hypothetical protein